MPSVLRDIVEDYADLLAAAGFTEFNQNREAHDPDGTPHRKFRIKLVGGRRIGDVQAGGVALEIFRTIRVEMHWDPETRESDIWSTVADDELTIDDVMLSDSNKPTGVRILLPVGGNVEEVSTREIVGTYDYEARFLETVTTT